MAEAIAALGLAANIFQFVGLGSKIVRLLWSSYRSASDVIEELPTPELVAKDLQTILENLQQNTETGIEDTEMASSLQDLVNRCHQIAAQVLELLNKIKMPTRLITPYRREISIIPRWLDINKHLDKILEPPKPDQLLHKDLDAPQEIPPETNPKRREKLLDKTLNISPDQPKVFAESVVRAWLAVWKEGEIRRLQKELDEMRQQLTMHLLLILRTQGRKSLDEQQDMVKQLSDVVQRTTRVEGIGLAILDLLTSQLDIPSQSIEKKQWIREFTSQIQNTNGCESPPDTAIKISPDRKEKLHSIFVAKLRFVLIKDREIRIPEAYKKTFEWIFEEKRTGSGKSTLMKFISRENCTLHSKCKKSLKTWAGDSKLVTASFYFWNSGSQLHMSRHGLFRSLLCQLLDQDPESISSVSPIRWEMLCLFGNLDNPDGWSDHELQEMLQKTVGHISDSGSKVCIFIDGLDEFDGDHHELITLFTNLISFPNVKLCVASRPWIIFEDAFKHKPSLMLQDLTYPDIEHFVNSKFHEDDNYKRLQQRDPNYANQLIMNVANKSAGVFLWVHLVVFSLLTGMSEGDRVSDLQRRLDALPADLETLYAKILSSIDATHLQSAIEIFQLMKASVVPPSLLLLSFADEENSNYALRLKLQSISPDQTKHRVEDMRRRLVSRCKGLVDVVRMHEDSRTTETDYTVQYLHRSVKDFLQSSSVHEDLQKITKSTFDPHLKLCAAHLCWLKTWISQLEDIKWSHVDACLKHAAQIRSNNKHHTSLLLNELDMTGQRIFENERKHGVDLWVNLEKLLKKDHIVAQSISGFTFMTLPVIYGITNYVSAKVNRGCYVVTPTGWKWPLLVDITYHCQSSSGAVLSNDARIGMLSCLLENRAKPNIRVDEIDYTYSPWSAIIRGAVGVQMAELLPRHQNRNFYDPKNVDLWLQMAKMMIAYGASTRHKTIKRSIMQQFMDARGKALEVEQRKEVEAAASKAAKWLIIECGLNPKWNRLKWLYP